ncbi:unnamed protein product [Sphagnum jensenii]|uniref:Glycosyltransferase n=1 Tax=Sphagnum jensenii TaxID=128206 RepID=A0ABP0WYK3_9BRYO
MGTLKRKWLCRGIKRTCVKRVVVLLVMLNALQFFLRQWLHSDLPRFGVKATVEHESYQEESELLDRSSFRFNLKEALGAWTLSKSKQSQGDEGRGEEASLQQDTAATPDATGTDSRAPVEQIHTILVNKVTCAQIVTQPAVVVTRFEYANLFHTVTDWYSVYMTAQIANLKQRPHLIFVDGHCKSSMDDGWQAMFSGLNFAKHLAGPVCFNHLIFSPLGYHSPLFKGLSSRHFLQGLQEFGEMFTSAFNLSSATRSPKKPRVAKVLFRASDELGVSVVNGLFAHIPMEEQLQEVQESSIRVGAHGAGLAHLLFARPEKTAILELVTPGLKRPHFPAMSHWMGMEYHAIEMRSPEADCSEVTDHVHNILSGLRKRHACNPLESHLESGEGMDKVHLSDMELK